MRKVKFSYRMTLQFSQPVWQHSFSLRAFPLRLPEQQICGFSWSIEPDVPLTFQRDCFGNVVGSGRFAAQHTQFQYDMSGVAWLEPARKKSERCPALYRYPSAACKMTTPLQQFLQQCAFSAETAGFARAVQLMDSLHKQFQYEAGVTSAFTHCRRCLCPGPRRLSGLRTNFDYPVSGQRYGRSLCGRDDFRRGCYPCLGGGVRYSAAGMEGAGPYTE